MKEVLLIAIGSAIVNNVVLSQFLGLCPFFGVSKKVNTAAGMGAAVISYYNCILSQLCWIKFILQQVSYTIFKNNCIYFSLFAHWFSS